jgi:hypothetical protein
MSSDGQTTYHINGTCSCQAGAHGKDCKHQHAWKLYQYIARKMEAQSPAPQPPATGAAAVAPLPEAPASLNLKVLISGHEVMVTLRDHDETVLMTRLQAGCWNRPSVSRPRGLLWAPGRSRASRMAFSSCRRGSDAGSSGHCYGYTSGVLCVRQRDLLTSLRMKARREAPSAPCTAILRE